MPKQEDFPVVYSRLKALFQPVVANLTVTEDTAATYALAGRPTPKYPQGMWVGGVQIRKNYVSYHLMPVYMFPDLLTGISDRLRKRMQGKSCFNFTAVDEDLLAELGRLTAAGFARTHDIPG